MKNSKKSSETNHFFVLFYIYKNNALLGYVLMSWFKLTKIINI